MKCYLSTSDHLDKVIREIILPGTVPTNRFRYHLKSENKIITGRNRVSFLSVDLVILKYLLEKMRSGIHRKRAKYL